MLDRQSVNLAVIPINANKNSLRQNMAVSKLLWLKNVVVILTLPMICCCRELV